MMMKIRNALVLLLFMFMASGVAIAKDDVLVQRMIDLERVYIPVLFLTSQEVPPAVPAMHKYAAAWEGFSDEYRTCRSSQRNWISYFDRVQDHVDEAVFLVDDGQLLAAHEEELELVRTTMWEFRSRNGFPKFVTDELTAFHTIMGEIITISKAEFDDDTIAILHDLYNDASHAWFKVEKNTVDPVAWGLSQGELLAYSGFVQSERIALDAFELALAGGDVPTIRIVALGLKPPQAKAYLLLGDL